HLLLSASGQYEPWRLQYLTDLTQLPDYEPGYRGYRGSTPGAPVDAAGNPVFYHVPKSYEAAKSDGERWRWLLAEAARLSPARQNDVDMTRADFLRSQFDVETMAYYGRSFSGDDRGKDTSGTYALHTLSETETIARLATGIKRFELPDEFNW